MITGSVSASRSRPFPGQGCLSQNRIASAVRRNGSPTELLRRALHDALDQQRHVALSLR
jgi:hypothetical protein